jgi:hypothetical protein
MAEAAETKHDIEETSDEEGALAMLSSPFAVSSIAHSHLFQKYRRTLKARRAQRTAKNNTRR